MDSEKVWRLFLHASCCNVRSVSAGARKCIPWEVHIRVHISVSLDWREAGGGCIAGGLVVLMEILACMELGRLLTK